MKSNFDYGYCELGNLTSQYADIDLSGHSCVEARYVKSDIAGFRGNPLIEALPPPLDNSEIIKLCTKELLDYDAEEIHSMPKYSRMLSLGSLRSIRFFLPFQGNLEYEFYKTLVSSYQVRKIVTDNKFRIPIRVNDKEGASSAKLGCDINDAPIAGFSLTGFSGCGKSSAMKILTDHYPQVIQHSFPNAPRVTQIVYLTVVCLPNSNFDALYIEIGKEIDDALGNLTPFYEEEIRKARGLGGKLNKIRELIELFSIGIIIFDEIQLIDFDSTKANSFDSLLSLQNMTKVGIGILGTEDACGKMFRNPRTARRIGAEISASLYCDELDYFEVITRKLFEYQWFDEKVELTKDIIDVLYDCTRGIIDQLLSLYIYIQYDYLTEDGNPTVDANYIRSVSNKYFSGMIPLLHPLKNQRDDAEIERKLAIESEHLTKNLQFLISEEQQKILTKTASEQYGSQEFAEYENLHRDVVRNIMNVTDAYSEDSIGIEFNYVYLTNGGSSLDKKTCTRMVMKRLQGRTYDKQQRRMIQKPNRVDDKKMLDFLNGQID